MDFGNIVGQLLQGGMTSATGGRLGHALGQSGLAGHGGLDQVLGGLLGGGSRAGGLGGAIGSIMSSFGGGGGGGGGQMGLGNLAANLLGGRRDGGGSLGGSAMVLLGTLAISALKNWQQKSQSADAADPGAAFSVSELEAQQMNAPETAELCLKAMISAAKADGQIQDDEMQRIVGKLEEGGISPEERAFVQHEMSAPVDIEGLARRVPNREIGAQVYAASLMAIRLDTDAERTYLTRLARALDLDGGAVQRLHSLVGAPL